MRPASFVDFALRQDSADDMVVLSPAAYVQGYASLARGEYHKAIAEFRRAAALDPLVTDPA